MTEIPITTITSKQGSFDENTLFCLGVCIDHNLPINLNYNPSRISHSIVTGNDAKSMVELLQQQAKPEFRQKFGLHRLPENMRVDFLEFDPEIFKELITSTVTPGIIHRIFYKNGIFGRDVVAGEIRTKGIQFSTLQDDREEVGIRVALK